MPSQLVYVDLQKGSLCSDSNGTALILPKIVAGDEVTLALRFLSSDGNGGYVVDNTLPGRVASLRMALGFTSAPVVSGNYRLRIGNATTEKIPFSAGSKELSEILNSTVGSPGDFEVVKAGNSFLIGRRNGAEASISPGPAYLHPVSYVSVDPVSSDGNWTYRLSILPAPLSFTDGADQVLPDPPAVTIVQHGGTDPSGTSIWPTIQNLFIPPTFQGSYQLVYGLSKTDFLDATSTAADIQAAINKVFKQSDQSVTVSNYAAHNAYITFGSKGFWGADVPPLGVNVFSAPPGDWTLSMNTATDQLLSLVSAGSTTLQFEGEAVLFSRDPIAGFPPPPTYRLKLWSVPVTVLPPLLHPEFNSAQVIDWLQPRSQSYIPFTSSQVITGQQNYTCALGDGSQTSFTIVHNLGTENLASVLVRENRSPGAVLVDGVGYSIEVLNANSLRIDFSSPPETNGMAISIMACGPASAFQAHTHSIEQIETLSSQLEYIGGKIAYLLSLVPKEAIAPSTNLQPNAVSSVASFGEILPDATLEDSPLSISSQVVPKAAVVTAVPGTALQEQLATQAAALAALNAQLAAAQKAVADATAAGATVEQAKQIAAAKSAVSKKLVATLSSPALGTTAAPSIWPPIRNNKVPSLFRALSGAPVPYSASSVPSPASASVGIIYQATSGLKIPLGGGRKTQTIPPGGYFAGNGKTFYRVYQGISGLWHPWEMDREISRIAVSSQTFPVGSSLQYSWNTTALLIPATFDTTVSNPDLFATYTMQVLAVPASSTSPTQPVVLASSPLNFSQAQETRSFTLEIERPADASIPASTYFTSYGEKTPGEAIPWGDFVLVVALREFRTDDQDEDSMGQLSLYVPPSQLTISK